MEKLFIVLITTKGSNIIEDIEVIRLMQQVVVSQCQTQSKYIFYSYVNLSIM
jgi:hypothetical protein